MKISEIISPKLALITWLDATNISGWFGSDDEIEVEPLEMKTVGWLIKQDGKIAVMAMTTSHYKVGELLIIPAGCIVSIDLLPPQAGEP